MCEHMVAYLSFCCGDGMVYSEKEIYDMMKEYIHDEWYDSFDRYANDFDYDQKEFFDNDFRISYYFFDYCPDCGERLSWEKTLNILNSKLSEYAKSLRKLPKPKKQKPYTSKKDTKSEPKKGYVYLVKLDKHYKIGISKKPSDRLKEFTLLPYELEEIIVKEVDNYNNVEEQLHEKYNDFRVRGEWFELSLEQVEEIKQYLTDLSNQK